MLLVFLTSLQQMCILVVLLVIGYVLARKGLLCENTVSDLVGILIKVLIPVMIFNALQAEYSLDLLKRGGIIFLATFVMMGISFLLSWGTARPLRVPQATRGDWVFGGIFSNVGFLGIPVIHALFQDEAASFYGTAVIVGANVVFGSAGIRVLQQFGPGQAQKGGSPWRVLFSAPVISFILGLICYCFQVPLPPLITAPLEMLGNLIAPIAMMTVGAMLTNCRMRDIFSNGHAYLLSLIRLLAVPVVMWLLLRLFVHDPMMVSVGTIMFGMPAAALMPGISLSNGGDSVWATKYTLLSTLLSIVTIPLLHVLSSI